MNANATARWLDHAGPANCPNLYLRDASGWWTLNSQHGYVRVPESSRSLRLALAGH